jgi:hypothetical protein
MKIAMNTNDVSTVISEQAPPRTLTKTYRACGGCRREFFSLEEYNEHECRTHKKVVATDPNGPMPGALNQGKMVMVNGVMVTETPSSAPFKGAKIGTTSNKNPMLKGENIDSTSGKDDGDARVNGMLDSIDSRLAATEKMTQMKIELSGIGIDCNTLNEEQTKAAYAKHIAEKGKVAAVGIADASPSDGGDDDDAGKAASGRRTAKPKG